MSFEKMVAVTDKPGLYIVVANRKDGLIIQDPETKKSTFASQRLHQFTPLAGITMYTKGDDMASLEQVMLSVKNNMDSNPAPDVKAADADLRAWFLHILPDNDPDMVKLNDIRKVIKWYRFLEKHNLLPVEKPAEDAAATEKPASEESAPEA